MYLTLLSESDRDALLLFESTNRVWFETHIAPREPEFYSPQGVKGHIRACLHGYEKKRLLPMLVVDEKGTILGRVNLSEIDKATQSAMLGYRVGECFTGKGVAKYAVGKILNFAKRIGLGTVVAYASVENTASQHVLLANGFHAVCTVREYTQVGGRWLDCIEYHRSLAE